MFQWILCLRYLRQRRIVLLSVVAVALSVALLVGVSSLFSGFIEAFRQSARRVMGDLLIVPPSGVEQDPRLLAGLEDFGAVEAVALSWQVPGLLRLDSGQVRQVEVWGIDAAAMARVTALGDFLDRQGPSDIALGTGPAGRLDAYAGVGLLVEPNEVTDDYDWTAARAWRDQPMLLFTGAMEGASGAAGETTFRRRTVRLTLRDIVFSGFYLIDGSVVFVPLEPLFRQVHPDAATVTADQIHVKLAAGVDPVTAAPQVRARFAALAREVLGWPEARIAGTDVITAEARQAAYLMEVHRQMGILMVVFGLVDVAVVFLVFCVFWLIVGLKRRDVAVMKSCGASGWGIAGLFLGFGACVGLVGSVLGVLLGRWFIAHVNAIEQLVARALGLRLWSSSLYLLHEIPHRFDLPAALGIAGVGVAAACAGALLPAWMAARTRPVAVLRYE